MKRAAVIIGAGLAGALFGGGLMVAIQAADRPATDAAARRTSVERGSTTLAPPSTRPLPSTTDAAPQAAPSVLLAWSRSGASRGLDPGLEPAAAGFPGVGATSLVRAGGLDLVGSRDMEGGRVEALAPGWAIPLDAAAVNPRATPTSFRSPTAPPSSACLPEARCSAAPRRASAAWPSGA